MNSREMIGTYVNLGDKIVHHIDGDPTNNVPGNLVALSRAEHHKIHGAMGGWRGHPGKRNKATIKRLNSLIHLYNEGVWLT